MLFQPKNVLCLAILSLFMVSCQRNHTLFEALPASKTHITFTNQLENKRLFNILYYLYYYNGGGVSIGDINKDGLADIYFTANSKGHNKLYLNKGNFEFEDITDKAGVAGTSDWCTGATMADVNGDGLLDIYVSSVSNRYGLHGKNELFINNGNNTFTESGAKYGLGISCFTTQTAFFDYDHDGDLDCYILNQSHHPHANIVNASFRNRYDSLSGDRLYRNDISSTGKFTDVTAHSGIYQSNLGYGLGLAIADFNNDGWEDVYVGNDFHENDYYYLNNGNGTFTESGADHFGHYSRFSMGNDAADYNNDGNIDVVTVDMLPTDEKTLKTYGSDENADVYKFKLTLNGYQYQYSRNCLQRNNGNGSSFSEIGLIAGVSATDWSWSALFADLDNDSNKDLFITSGIVKRPVDLDYIKFVSDLKMKGLDKTDKWDDNAINAMPDGASHPYLYKGDGKQRFHDSSKDWGTAGLKGYFNGAAYGDLDNDGDLDLVVNSLNAPAVVLQNNSPKKDFISIAFKGEGMNTGGIGAKAYVFAQNKMQYQQLMLTRGFESSSDTRLHFGLDSAKVIDSLLIVWPDQRYQVIRNVRANQRLTVLQQQASGKFDHDSFFKPVQPFFSQSTDSIRWQHQEDDFVDYNVQYLIPHAESTRGPKLAVGDVNGDGLDDFYACGAKGQAGSLMIQQKNGSFVPSDTALFHADAACEDVDALFFDANGDHSPDLYVVSGGNEYPENSPALADRLYLNDGKGGFTKAPNSLPSILENKSCVTAADIDKDGDLDLFVGHLANSMAYGIPQTSYLFLNDGKAHFSLAGKNIIPLTAIGMVTSASFTDINKDSWPDLIVTGEWMPLKLFFNNHGTFKSIDLPKSTGLWQTVYTTDINGDGLTDILAGNWGYNSKLSAGKDGPLKLYVKDFDNNGSIEQIMAYTIDGQEYPFLAKDELERRLPVLRKAYVTYSEVAGKTLKFMLYDLFKDYTELKAEVLGSSCFINNGKEGFTRYDLPQEVQLAPIFSFQHVTTSASTENLILAGGNFFDVIPYEGRYDAQPLALFSIKKNNTATYIHQPNLDEATMGQIRDLKWLRTQNGKVLVVAQNNGPLKLFTPKKPV